MTENQKYLTEQIITYIGNKRKLLPYIEATIKDIVLNTGETQFVCADLFSGSGIVARFLKQYSNTLYVNDMEGYSKIINDCYLTNQKDFDLQKYIKYKQLIENELKNNFHSGIIANNYAPKDENNIKENERVFYTPYNAQYIDTVRDCIDSIDPLYRKYFIAPLLYEASVHSNTSGIFKGFYKDSTTKTGKYGGNGDNCLDRIKAKIELKQPIFSNFNSEVSVFQEDTNILAKRLTGIDITYLDPPYNQHPYGSNYFMLNTILNNKLGNNLSKVSGIPDDWNRSNYNKKSLIKDSLEQLVQDLNSRFIIISYNSEGFMEKEDIEKMLSKYGTVKAVSINYNTYRGCRNLDKRNLYVDEYLFVLSKEGVRL